MSSAVSKSTHFTTVAFFGRQSSVCMCAVIVAGTEISSSEWPPVCPRWSDLFVFALRHCIAGVKDAIGKLQ